MIQDIPEDSKALKPGQSVTVGSRTYKGHCPAGIHPDNLKVSDTSDHQDLSSETEKEDSDKEED